jgi:tRNA(Ile)-lysidine synthase
VNALEPAWRLSLHFIHFNHGLRPESAEEALFVAALARDHQLPFHLCESTPNQVREWSREGGGLQESARDWRRAESARVLAGLASVSGERFVVTGHHRDDQVETVLMKLLRGVHLSRIQGMLPVSPPNEHGARVLRPLLSTASKQDLRAYCEATRQAWREDASNASGKYKRNVVRSQLVPLMEELAGGQQALAQRLGSLEAQSAALRRFLEGEAAAWEAAHGPAAEGWLPLEAWEKLDQGPVRTEVLHRFLSRHGTLSAAHLSRVESRLLDRNDRAWVLHLPGGSCVERADAFLRTGLVVESAAPSPVRLLRESPALAVQTSEEVFDVLRQRNHSFECQEGGVALGRVAIALTPGTQRRLEVCFRSRLSAAAVTHVALFCCLFSCDLPRLAIP